jgi:hypothetical protein
MNSEIYYEDIEKEVVSFFLDKLDSDEVLVATKAPGSDETNLPPSWLVITIAPGRDKTPVTRFYGLTLELYAPDYATASSLSRDVDYFVRNLTESDSIKSVQVIAGPTRLGEESPKEKRNFSVELVVKAWTN